MKICDKKEKHLRLYSQQLSSFEKNLESIKTNLMQNIIFWQT